METPIDARKMRAARKATGLSQDQAAKEIGVTKATVQNWESGRRKNLGYAYLTRAAEVYRADPGSLLQDLDAGDAADEWGEEPAPD